jgi:hypothetical protein
MGVVSNGCQIADRKLLFLEAFSIRDSGCIKRVHLIRALTHRPHFRVGINLPSRTSELGSIPIARSRHPC